MRPSTPGASPAVDPEGIVQMHTLGDGMQYPVVKVYYNESTLSERLAPRVCELTTATTLHFFIMARWRVPADA